MKMTIAMRLFNDLEYGQYDRSFEYLKSICNGTDPEKPLEEILTELIKINYHNQPAEGKFSTLIDLALCAIVSQQAYRADQVAKTLSRYRKSCEQPRKVVEGYLDLDQQLYNVVKAYWPKTPTWAFDAIRVFGDKDNVIDKTMTWAVLIDEEESPARLEIELVPGFESCPIVFQASESMSFVTVAEDTQSSLEYGLNYALGYLRVKLPRAVDFRWRLRRIGRGIEKISGESISGAFCLCCVRLLQQYQELPTTAT